MSRSWKDRKASPENAPKDFQTKKFGKRKHVKLQPYKKEKYSEEY